VNTFEAEQERVRGYYLHYLNRTADPSGLTLFAGDLRGGMRDEDVIAAVVRSEEYLGRQ
jgi:hypothetical protein